MSKEQDCPQGCEHYWSWQFKEWDIIPQHVTKMVCKDCGERRTRKVNPETGVLEKWEIVKEGKLRSGPSNSTSLKQ